MSTIRRQNSQDQLRRRVTLIGGTLGALLVFVVRLWALNATSIWYDEAFMLAHAREGVVQAVAGLFQEDNAIPIYGFLLAIWVQLAGDGEFAVRYLSVLLGTLGAPLILKLGQAVNGHHELGTVANHTQPRVTGNGVAGLGALLAYATLPILVYYSQEVRMYALAVPLAAGFAWAGWRLIIKRRGEIIYVSLGVLMLAAHLYTALMWAAIGIWGTIITLCFQDANVARPSSTGKRSFSHLAWWRANLILGVLSLPILIWAFWRLQADATAVSAVPFEALRWIPVQFGVGQYLGQPWSAIFIATTGLTILLALGSKLASRQKASALWLVTTLTLPIVMLFVLTSIKAKWSERYLLPSWGIALVIAVGTGWETLGNTAVLAQRRRSEKKRRHRHSVGEAALGGLAILLLATWLALVTPALARQAQGTWAVALQDEWHPRPDFRSIAHYIESRDSPDDAIAVVGGYAATNLAYYYDGPAYLFGIPVNTRILNTEQVVDLSVLEALEDEVGTSQRLWLVLWQDHLADPTNLVQSVLVEACHRLPVQETFTNVSLLLFDLNNCRPLDQLATPAYPLDISFQAPIRLEGYDLVRHDDVWEVDLWWQSSGELQDNYIVFVHLVGADNEMISQHDHIAGADSYPTSTWQEGVRLRDRFFLAVPNEIDNDAYLRVGLYTTEGRIPLTNGQEAVILPFAQPSQGSGTP